MSALTRTVPALSLEPGMQIVIGKGKRKITTAKVETVTLSRRGLKVIVNGRLVFDRVGSAEVLA